MLIILFGKSGSGKNYIGKIFQEKFGFFSWDGDQILTQKMLHSIREEKSFTQKMRDVFTKKLITSVKKLRKPHKNLVVMQALFKEKNRRKILKTFPDAIFIFVKCRQKTIESRFKKNTPHLSFNYLRQLNKHFQKPQLPHETLLNESGSKSIKKQVQHMLSQKGL